MSEKVQIDKQLFINIIKIICIGVSDEQLQEKTKEQLNKKLNSLIRREIYTKYKTAISEEERMEYIKKYININKKTR